MITLVGLEVLPCESQNPTTFSTTTKSHKFKKQQNEQETQETLQEQNPEIRKFLLKYWSSICTYTRLKED